MLVGLALGLTTLFNDLRLSSDLVFYVFLPILLFEAAFNLEARHLIADWRRILALAVPGVLVAFALTAIGLHLLGGATWTIALLFGALIAATDPVSVVAMFRRLGVPERLTTMIDAESLFNDGTAAVVFAIVVAPSECATSRRSGPPATSCGWRPAASPWASPSATPLRPCTVCWTTTSSRCHAVHDRRLRLVPARPAAGHVRRGGLRRCRIVVGNFGSAAWGGSRA